MALEVRQLRHHHNKNQLYCLGANEQARAGDGVRSPQRIYNLRRALCPLRLQCCVVQDMPINGPNGI